MPALILGNAQVPMLQIIYYTSSTAIACYHVQLSYIETFDDFDCGNEFDLMIHVLAVRCICKLCMMVLLQL